MMATVKVLAVSGDDSTSVTVYCVDDTAEYSTL